MLYNEVKEEIKEVLSRSDVKLTDSVVSLFELNEANMLLYKSYNISKLIYMLEHFKKKGAISKSELPTSILLECISGNENLMELKIRVKNMGDYFSIFMQNNQIIDRLFLNSHRFTKTEIEYFYKFKNDNLDLITNILSGAVNYSIDFDFTINHHFDDNVLKYKKNITSNIEYLIHYVYKYGNWPVDFNIPKEGKGDYSYPPRENLNDVIVKNRNLIMKKVPVEIDTLFKPVQEKILERRKNK